MARKTSEPTIDLKTVFGIAPTDAVVLMEKLTPRQREVAELIATGTPKGTIAKTLGISPKTLDIHRSWICMKFDQKVIGIPKVVFASKFAGHGE